MSGPSASASPRDVPFTEVARTQLSGHDGPAAVRVGGSELVVNVRAPSPPDRLLVGAFQGSQRTGGYAITIDRITRDGDRLIVRATFTEPPPGAIVTQVLTSPAHVVSIGSADAAGLRTVILLDAMGNERARTGMAPA